MEQDKKTYKIKDNVSGIKNDVQKHILDKIEQSIFNAILDGESTIYVPPKFLNKDFEKVQSAMQGMKIEYDDKIRMYLIYLYE
jgi:hypothetical protein